jgi:hypothetical protein
MPICSTHNCLKKTGKNRNGTQNLFCGNMPCKLGNVQAEVVELQCHGCMGKTKKGNYCKNCVDTKCRRYVCTKCAGWFPSHVGPPWSATPSVCHNCDRSPVPMPDVQHDPGMDRHVGRPWCVVLK